MAAPVQNVKRVLHPQNVSCRELCICDETQTDQSAAKFGWGVAPVAASARTTFTQTYATADAEVKAATAAAVATTGSTNTTPYGYTTSAQADAIVTAINALEADVLQDRKVLNKIIDALQALGIVL